MFGCHQQHPTANFNALKKIRAIHTPKKFLFNYLIETSLLKNHHFHVTSATSVWVRSATPSRKL